MLKSARRSAEEWKAIIEDFLKSGMLQKDYAGEHELSRATLSAWGKRLGIPLSTRGRQIKVDKEFSPSMSFIDIEPLRTIGIPSALKMEIIFPQGHILKLETASGWESVGAFIRDLVG
jgi:hypothetical protein